MFYIQNLRNEKVPNSQKANQQNVVLERVFHHSLPQLISTVRRKFVVIDRNLPPNYHQQRILEKSNTKKYAH